MRTDWRVLVPVKVLATAKSRTGLPQAERAALALAMLADVLAAARACPAVASVHVLSADPEVARLARHLDASLIVSPAGPGLNAEVAHALADPALEGPVCVLVADLPALTAADLAGVLAAAPESVPSFVPSLDDGTTMLLLPPGTALMPAFGPRSAAMHARGATRIADASDRARLDVDTPADLGAAARLGLGERTAAWLRDRSLTTSA